MAYGLEYIIKRKPFIDGTILNNLSRLGENMGMELVKCFCQMFRGLKAELGMSMRMFSQRSTQGKFDVHNNYTVFSYSQQHNPPVRNFSLQYPTYQIKIPRDYLQGRLSNAKSQTRRRTENATTDAQGTVLEGLTPR